MNFPKTASARALLAATKAALAATVLSADFAMLSGSPAGAIASPMMMDWIASAALPNSSGVNPDAANTSTVFGHFAVIRLAHASPVVGGLPLSSLVRATSSAFAAASLLALARNFSIFPSSSVVRGMAPASLSSSSGMAARAVGRNAKAAMAQSRGAVMPDDDAFICATLAVSAFEVNGEKEESYKDPLFAPLILNS